MIMGLYTTLEGMTKRSLAPIIAGFLFSTFSSSTPFIVGLAVSFASMVLMMKMTTEPSASLKQEF